MDLAKYVDSSLAIGSMISAYQLDRALGSGGMGSVFRARHVLDGHIAALKVLHEGQLRQRHAIDRMMREAAVLATVQHPGVPRFFECGTLPDGRPWIAMELVDGRSLSDVLVDTRLSHEVIAELVSQLADVLAAAHVRGIVHRDLKPDNVLLTPNDAAFPLRVIDWGIAIHQSAARVTKHDEAIGTPTYMAPEQARGCTATSRTDIYGLGVVAYRALAGRAPFTAATSLEILVHHLSSPVPPLAPRCPDAPIALCELVESMLAKCGEDRPTAAQVHYALRQLRSAGDGCRTAPGETAPEPIEVGHSSSTVVVRGVQHRQTGQ